MWSLAFSVVIHILYHYSYVYCSLLPWTKKIKNIKNISNNCQRLCSNRFFSFSLLLLFQLFIFQFFRESASREKYILNVSRKEAAREEILQKNVTCFMKAKGMDCPCFSQLRDGADYIEDVSSFLSHYDYRTFSVDRVLRFEVSL